MRGFFYALYSSIQHEQINSTGNLSVVFPYHLIPNRPSDRDLI